jgi:SpoIID/LytB domain protein
MAPRRSRIHGLRVLLLCAAGLVGLVLLAPSPARADVTFTVNGRGWGHGIGLSQYGAKGYAEQGRTFDWILAHYYQQTDLSERVAPTVKVDLDAGKGAHSSWRVAPGGSATMTVAGLTDPGTVVRVAPHTSVWVTFKSGKSRVCADHYDPATKKHSVSTVLKTYAGSVIAAAGSQAVSTVRLMSASGPFDQTGIIWRGVVRFTASSDTSGHAVNWVGMEDYLRGVVPRESPSSWPIEALKAQAVAARSYAYGAASSGSVLYCTTMSQVYNGASDGTERHETDRTDDAVAKTANEVVTHGSTVVKTFFSSSSGGRTANSKDVWFSDAADDVSPVYYTSVADADDDSPNYRWAPSEISGASLASKVRSHYADHAQASPATVIGVSSQLGTSGFVRFVTLRWSNGKSTTLMGPELQHALGLKSSAFAIVAKAPPAPAATRYQQPDSRLVWAGTWTPVKDSSWSGGSYRYASRSGARMTASFKGTSVSWIGSKASTFGKADVYLDGALKATVDLYASSAQYRKALYTKSGLSADTTHTLMIKVLGTRDAKSRGSKVAVDAVDVVGKLVPAPRPVVWTRYEQKVSAIRYAGVWTAYSSSVLSGGSYRYASSRSSVATFTFSGTRVRWIGRLGSSFGRAQVSLDGGPAVLVDLYAATSIYQRSVWDSGTIGAGTHVLTVRPARLKDAHSHGYNVGVDAFDVLSLAS